jgi:hypothetical protein
VATESEFLKKAQSARPQIDQMAQAFATYVQVLQNEMGLAEAEE